MFGMLDILLILALATTLAVTIMTRQSTGPEGPVGAWLGLLIPCLFVAILVFVMLSQGSLNFIPGGGLTQFVIVVGVLITFSICIFGTLVHDAGMVQVLLIVVPYLLLASCAAIIHQADLPNPGLVHLVTAILLGGAALAGWGVAGTGIFLYMQKEIERSALQAQKEREQEEEREQWEVAEYAKLDDSPPLSALLGFMWSRNDQVRRQAREQVRHFPGLDDKLIELLDHNWKEAISYIAKVYEKPPSKLAPAWGRMLERKLKAWDHLQHIENAGTWELNLKNYFEGARKIQIAGGSLHAELLSWHKYLLKCNGLGNLADFVKNLLVGAGS